MKRIFTIGVIFIILLAYHLPVDAALKSEFQDIEAKAEAIILLERDTGEILFEKNKDKKLPPASLTKIMTLLLVMEAIEQKLLALNDTVVVSEKAASMGGSQVFLSKGEEITVEELIKAVAIASGNDASVALAEAVSGTEANFVAKMNEKAEALGLKNTKFQNASGLPAKDHYTTAYDLSMMSKELLKYEKITDYTSIYEDYLRKGKEDEFWLVNTNRLIRSHPYIDGLKTGYTKEASFCLAATAVKDQMRVISVVMGADSAKDRNEMTTELIDYAFATYQTEQIFEPGEMIGQFTHLQSEKYAYPLKTSESLSLLYKKGERKESFDIDLSMISPQKLPIEQGEQLGSLIIRKEKDVIESPIYADEKIAYGSLYTLMKRSLSLIAKNE